MSLLSHIKLFRSAQLVLLWYPSGCCHNLLRYSFVGILSFSLVSVSIVKLQASAVFFITFPHLYTTGLFLASYNRCWFVYSLIGCVTVYSSALYLLSLVFLSIGSFSIMLFSIPIVSHLQELLF